MLFNSLDFALFLPIVFLLYWFVAYRNLRIQNAFIVAASFVFYGWWDWRFLGLLLLSTLVDYVIALRLSAVGNKTFRKALLLTSVIVNLGLLGFFKYYNFFIDNFIEAFSLFGKRLHVSSLDVILPVGISFYTFQTMSYTLDVYKRTLKPTKDLVAFVAYVCFFPQLVAGPIERAANLLPQFYRKRVFERDKAVDGLRQILLGLFKKVVIADNCASYANLIFNDYQDYNGSTLLLGAVFFTFQIYCDFSGYSDIAIGTSRLFGFNLKENFATPYFSRDVGEFWRRWHISLSSWFKDYLYIPLGGSRGGIMVKVRNTLIIFLVSGFWHGANWTFLVWGGLNALYFLPLLIFNLNRSNLGMVAEGKSLPTFREFLQISLTFWLTVLAWIFFRSESLATAFGFLERIALQGLFNLPNFSGRFQAVTLVGLIFGLLSIEWINRGEAHSFKRLPDSKVYRRTFYYIILLIILFESGPEQQFIYFQF